jgi:hypothetical protein
MQMVLSKVFLGLYVLEENGILLFGKSAQDALIMNIDDLLCVGATDNIILSLYQEEINLIPESDDFSVLMERKNYLKISNLLELKFILQVEKRLM